MKIEVNEIVSLLKMETNHYKQLESLLIQQQNLLITKNNGELEEINLFIEEKCKQILKIKSDREKRLIINDKMVFLEELEFYIEKEQFERISRYKNRLNLKIERVKYIQSVNKMLLEHVIRYNKKRMSLFRVETESSYGKNGRIQKEQKRLLVNRSI